MSSIVHIYHTILRFTGEGISLGRDNTQFQVRTASFYQSVGSGSLQESQIAAV